VLADYGQRAPPCTASWMPSTSSPRWMTIFSPTGGPAPAAQAERGLTWSAVRVRSKLVKTARLLVKWVIAEYGPSGATERYKVLRFPT
jgi:hypothetical protein